jgi:hypothetical protein
MRLSQTHSPHPAFPSLVSNLLINVVRCGRVKTANYRSRPQASQVVLAAIGDEAQECLPSRAAIGLRPRAAEGGTRCRGLSSSSGL